MQDEEPGASVTANSIKLNSSKRGKWKRRARLEASRGQGSCLNATKKHEALVLVDEENGGVHGKKQNLGEGLTIDEVSMVLAEAACQPRRGL